MKSFLLAAASTVSLSMAGGAYADCAADLAMMDGQASKHDGISKDGSLAPLQSQAADTPDGGTASPATTPSPSGAGEIAKDGSTAPMQPSGDAVPDQAMSGQDAQAQQDGAPTAAEQAASDEPTDAHSMAVEEARAALAKGDEAACKAALEKAKAT